MKERLDDYNLRRNKISHLSDQELKQYFYELTNKLVDPLLKLSYENTTKSIERSVLLRMGFSSLQAKEIVDRLNEHNLLRKGAGHCVYKISTKFDVSLEESGEMVLTKKGIDYLLEVFKHD